MELLNAANYIAIFLLASVAIYLIGFGIGRRSAYRDVDKNLPIPIKRASEPTLKPQTD